LSQHFDRNTISRSDLTVAFARFPFNKDGNSVATRVFLSYPSQALRWLLGGRTIPCSQGLKGCPVLLPQER
jgi:hypothetical protein